MLRMRWMDDLTFIVDKSISHRLAKVVRRMRARKSNGSGLTMELVNDVHAFVLNSYVENHVVQVSHIEKYVRDWKRSDIQKRGGMRTLGTSLRQRRKEEELPLGIISELSVTPTLAIVESMKRCAD